MCYSHINIERKLERNSDNLKLTFRVDFAGVICCATSSLMPLLTETTPPRYIKWSTVSMLWTLLHIGGVLQSNFTCLLFQIQSHLATQWRRHCPINSSISLGQESVQNINDDEKKLKQSADYSKIMFRVSLCSKPEDREEKPACSLSIMLSRYPFMDSRII